MTYPELIDKLATMTNRDEAGRHFTERYTDEELEYLENEGLITITRPIHEPTGIPYDRQYWSLEVTEDGIELVNG